MAVVKSLSFDQDEILKGILSIYGLKRFDVDLTYGNGSFYKNIPEPKYAFDIEPQTPNTEQADSTDTPLRDSIVRSAMFDPPFLTYIKKSREHNSIMARRFSGYWSYRELEDHYRDTLKECYRILKPKGILVFKCQDIVHNHQLNPTHINVVAWAHEHRLKLKDLYVLGAKHRMPMPGKDRTQKHARIYHSYFLVFQKKTDREK